MITGNSLNFRLLPARAHDTSADKILRLGLGWCQEKGKDVSERLKEAILNSQDSTKTRNELGLSPGDGSQVVNVHPSVTCRAIPGGHNRSDRVKRPHTARVTTFDAAHGQ